MSEQGFSLVELVSQRIADDKKEKEYASWRASSMGKCLREHYYRRLGVKPTSPPDERKDRVFKVGDIFHEWIQNMVLDSMGKEVFKHGEIVAVEVEKELSSSKWDNAGRCDLLIMFADGYLILIDIKTINSRAFWHLENSHKNVKDKFPQYWVQLGDYMLMSKLSGVPVDEGRILLVSKDDLMMKEVTYLLTEELEERVKSELSTLNQHWADKTLPPCTCNQLYLDKNGKSSGPKYCSYRDPDTPSQCCNEYLAKDKLIKEE